MPYPNEHACRLNNPDKYDSMRRKNCDMKSGGKCLDVIYGIKSGKSEIQAYRYKKTIWSASAARSHCSSHNGSFEAASGGDNAHIDNPLLQDANNRRHEYISCHCKEENE